MPGAVSTLPGDGAPLDYFFHSAGPVAHATMVLAWVLAGIVVAVCLIVLALLVYALLKRRVVRAPEIIGRESGGLRAVAVGTVISTILLFGMATYSLVVLNANAQPDTPPALTVRVVAYDWWWRVEYLDATGATVATSANEIHIPVGQPVAMRLDSADVIHAFWVPRLAGKTQMIPGQTNQQWLQADAPGIYRGQCTQYCGVQHARMALEVVAQPQASFDAFLKAEALPAQINDARLRSAGGQVFLAHCAGCHTVRGTPATGDHAPDLTHLGSRRLLAAGQIDNTPENLEHWIVQAQTIKPGSRMPNIALTAAELKDVSQLLAQLK